MSVAEAGRIFKAIAKRTVDTDMGDPNQPAGGKHVWANEKSRKRECKRERGRMGEIVGNRADTRTGEIGEHRQIRRQEEKRKRRPGKAVPGKDCRCGGECGEGFEP